MDLVHHIINEIKFNGNFSVIGIDGPTASGKTTLANSLAKELDKKHIPYFIYRLDWTLTDRENRQTQLNTYISNKSEFEFEADLQMNLNLIVDFLNKIEKLRHQEFTSISFELNNLYNRDDNGKCNAKALVELVPQMIIIVEGHYTHHQKINHFFDQNYLLFAKPLELLKRKIDRVKDYRDPQHTTDYFNFIDWPSFNHYFIQNYGKIKNIFLNEEFNNQIELKHQTVNSLFNIEEYLSKSLKSKTKFYDNILKTIAKNHNDFVQVWGIHPLYRDKSFVEILENHCNEISWELAFLNIYMDKSNSFSYRFGLKNNEDFILISGSNIKINIILANHYTKIYWEIDCNENAIITDNTKTIAQTKLNTEKEDFIIAPNRLLIPSFIKKTNNKKFIFYQEQDYAFSNISNLFFDSFLYVFKPSSSKENLFISELFNTLNYKYVIANKYIFSANFYTKTLSEEFSKFADELSGYKNNIFDEDVNEEDLEKLTELNCIYRNKSIWFTEQTDYQKLKDLFPNLHTSTKILLSESLAKQNPNIEIAPKLDITNYLQSLPISLNELYFAISISGNKAIPFLSLYHINDNSIDIQTYFDFFAKKSASFGLQASLNALGIENEQGYLEIAGPKDMAKAIKNNLIKYLQNNSGQALPVWSLGIDHIKFEENKNDLGFKFTNQAFETEWIKTYCIDIASIIGDENKAYKTIFNELLKNIDIGNNDIELYISDEKFFENIEPKQAIDICAKICSDFANSLNSNNQTFILGPFLGSLHHQLHNKIDPELSQNIHGATKQYGNLGNVLHGTSFTPFESIRDLINKNCIRINFAGKLLFALVNGLPSETKASIGSEQNDIKRNIGMALNKESETNDINSSKSLKTELNEIFKNGIGFSLNEHENQWFRQNKAYFSQKDFHQIIDIIIQTQTDTNTSINKAIILASMIEVPYEIFSGGLVKNLVKYGLSHFHIDIGDGEFISRKLDGLQKLEYLQKYFPETTTHLHLMVKDPFKGNGTSYISQLASIKKSLIYLHPEAYNNSKSWQFGADFIRRKDCIPGLVLTVEETEYIGAVLAKMKQAGLNNILVMGVPIGRGGQNFVRETILKIDFIKNWSQTNNYKIDVEVDGGLSDKYIYECTQAGAKYLSGWSMFLKYGINEIEKRVKELING